MTVLPNWAVFATTLYWRLTDVAKPPDDTTVLLSGPDVDEPKAGYRHGDDWYSVAGERIAQVTWWSPLPESPPTGKHA